jgi:hypothetical protein
LLLQLALVMALLYKTLVAAPVTSEIDGSNKGCGGAMTLLSSLRLDQPQISA